MSNNFKYELVLEQVNEIAKTMKHLYDFLGISPRDAERFAKSAPVVVASFASENEAVSKKAELEIDGSARYGINKASVAYRVVIYDCDYGRRTKIIPGLMSVLGIKLDEAKRLTDVNPVVVKRGISLDEAENLKSALLSELIGLCSDIRAELDI